MTTGDWIIGIGASFLIAGVAAIYLPAAFVVLGVFLLLIGLGVANDR